MTTSLPDPSLARLILECLAKCDGEALTSQIQASVLSSTGDPKTLNGTLEWLRDAGLLEETSHDRWRVARDPFVPRDELLGAERLGLRIERILSWGRSQTSLSDPIEILQLAAAERELVPESVRRAVDEIPSAAVSANPTVIASLDLAADFESIEGAEPEFFDAFRRYEFHRPGPRPSIAALARESNTTRAKIEKNFSKIRAAVDRFAFDRNSNLWSVSARLREHLGAAAPESAVADFVGQLGRASEVIREHPHRSSIVLSIAFPELEIRDGWVTSPNAFTELTSTVRQKFTENLVLPIGEVVSAVEAVGVKSEWSRKWIDDQPYLRVEDDAVLWWGASMADKGVALIELAGEPVSLEELFEQLGENKNFRSFKGQVQGDPRVLRRGVKQYGLSRWGGEEYTKLTDEMEQEIERRGGEANLEELAEFLAKSFGASTASVRMYASAHPFVVDADGVISVTNEQAEVPGNVRPIAETRCCVRIGGKWALRKIVDEDVLRGSGTGLPMAMAVELGLVPGGSLDIDSPYGPINVSWPSHMTHLGSLTQIVRAEKLELGDRVFLIHAGASRFEVEIVRASALENLRGAALLAAECGQGPAEVPMEQLSRALGFDSNVGASVLRTRLRGRREGDLASLVPEMEEHEKSDLLDELWSL